MTTKTRNVKCPKVKPAEYVKPLKFGDKGPAVEFMAFMLGQKGSALKPTGVFHIGMRSAVIGFQKKNGLKPTGIIDKKTWAKVAAK